MFSPPVYLHPPSLLGLTEDPSGGWWKALVPCRSYLPVLFSLKSPAHPAARWSSPYHISNPIAPLHKAFQWLPAARCRKTKLLMWLLALLLWSPLPLSLSLSTPWFFLFPSLSLLPSFFLPSTYFFTFVFYSYSFSLFPLSLFPVAPSSSLSNSLPHLSPFPRNFGSQNVSLHASHFGSLPMLLPTSGKPFTFPATSLSASAPDLPTHSHTDSHLRRWLTPACVLSMQLSALKLLPPGNCHWTSWSRSDISPYRAVSVPQSSF